MAEVNAKDLTTKTAPASTDSMLLFGTTTNEGAKITVDNLANNILERLATKTFPNQVGGSSAATILAQLATLNSNIATTPPRHVYTGVVNAGSSYTVPSDLYSSMVLILCVYSNAFGGVFMYADNVGQWGNYSNVLNEISITVDSTNMTRVLNNHSSNRNFRIVVLAL